MRRLTINGIPHWFDGELALPVMEGGQIDLNDPKIRAMLGLGGDEDKGKSTVAEPPSGQGTIVVAPDGTQYTVKAIYIPDARRWAGYLMNQDGTQAIPMTGGGGPFRTPGGHEISFDEQGNITETRTLSEAERNAGGGGGGGSDHYATDVSAMLQKMQDLKSYWQQQIENVNSGVTYEAGKAGFEADWAKLVNDWEAQNAVLQQNAQDLQARLEDAAKEREITDVRSRETEEAARRVQVAQEATRRASVITGDVLPRFVTGNNPINVPFLGPTRGTNVNFGELFNQGGAGNLNTLPAIAPQFAGGYGATQVAAPPQLPPMGPMPTYPGAPQYPAMPGALQSWLGI